MRVGYIIASHHVMKDGKPIRFMYREAPDNELDSGWRVFSGEETQAYADEASNFSMYNASTVVQQEPAIAELLVHNYPIAFELDGDTGQYREVPDDDG